MVAYETAAIIGTGTMGPGMGAVLERAGLKTFLFDIDSAALDRARAGVDLASGVLDRLDAPQVPGGSIHFSMGLEEAVREADLAIDAPSAKRKVAGSDAGSPNARFPPSVPTFRTRTFATCRVIITRLGHPLPIALLVSIERWVAAAPILSTLPSTVMASRPGIRLMSTRWS